MFERLQKKWKVGGLQLALIIATFAIGGSVTGYAGKKIMNLLALQQDWLWTVIYILLITIIWPLAVIIISIPFGQFSFFIKYIRKIGGRMGLVRSRESLVVSPEIQPPLPTRHPPLTNIAIFASGAGSNAQKIIDHFKDHFSVRISLIVCNNPQAGVLRTAEKENIPALIIEKERFFRGDAYIKELTEKNIDLVVLAGFLWKIPGSLLKAFRNRIINIHPALLPKYGGKGMYGQAVHEAVIAAKEKESGITIHYADELYDHGKIIFQARCAVLENDTAESLAQRIHALEHEHYARIIEDLLK
ncbi:MAG TPA: phosphoribosylglycinamide formyltransferase [Chitinophagaceae bacterium]|nr:phosphoribosylglycinamide formyltransferase [Chitinophagaceae bacterium]